MHRAVLRLTSIATLSLLATLPLIASCSSVQKQTQEERMTVLKAQVDDLDRQLIVIHETTGEEQQTVMRQYWDMLQKQLIYVRNLPGVEAHGCNDWTMQDHAITGQGAFIGSRPCPSFHDGGPSSGLPFPAQLSPLLFQLMMHQELDTLTAQVEAIEAETNKTVRLDLIRQHYETRYRDLQTVLGRDWMWANTKESDLPDAASMGAVLFSQYCSQCHNAPPPSLNTPAVWGYVTQRMSTIIEHQAHSGEMGVNFPSADEFQLIAQYLMTHGERPAPPSK
jgi:mono/diheme cytochrome c family protein